MMRDQKLIALFASLSVLTGGLVGARIFLDDPLPVPSISQQVPLGGDDRVSIQFLGDTMLGGAYPRLISERGQGDAWPFAAIRPALAAADYVVAVAEAPITELTRRSTPPPSSADPFFTSPPPAAAALARAGVDALSLATDHSFDAGPAGLVDTIRHSEAAGLATFGAGPDLARAEQPLLLRTEFGTVGIVGIGESFGHRARKVGPDAEPGPVEKTAGTAVLSPAAVQRGVDLARAAGAAWVVGFVHWGDSWRPIAPRQRYWAEVFARAGYDLVVGSGPHIAQQIENLDGMPVAYSIGNFVYGKNGRYARLGIPGYGLSVGLDLDASRTPVLTVRCLLTDNRVVAFQPRPCNADEAAAFLPTLNPELRLEGDRAVLPCNGCFQRRETQ
jgi:poly-gamma-glutamate synthesis protein (capsule biosynthesis protein)